MSNALKLDIAQCIANIQDGRRDTDRKHIARRRWGILAKALKSPIPSQPTSPTDEISMRRFASYMLLTAQPLQEDIVHHQSSLNISIEPKAGQNGKRKSVQYKKRTWYRYSAQIGPRTCHVDIGHISRSFTAADLMGFNNTGNVCVWPSEEALAYYVLNNLAIFKGQSVLELGAGMSALAGLMVAKYGEPKLVNLTDGNGLAVENVKLSLEKNSFDCIVDSEVLQWGISDGKKRDYNVILSADCLFFDEARNELIETIWESLAGSGLALVMAPKRGDTLEIFLTDAEMRGFQCQKMLVYNEDVWRRHLQCLDNPEADYWKSQAKKYCDFCKCWIADNRPSVEFHEKGRKHQDNVARRLKTISKQSRRDQKESVRVDAALKRMESAALEAYRKDIENNADMSSRAINETLEKSNLALASKKIWHEFRPKDGPVYYWNTETKETIWSAPSCGYLSVAEQEAQAFVSGKQQLQDVDKFKKRHDRLKLEEDRQQDEEERAAAVREKMKARRVVEEVEEEVPVPGPIIEQPSGPYGNWRTVEKKPRKIVDLQLPKGEELVALYIPAEKPAPPPKVFKEKTITSLTADEDTSCATTSFKKRKFPNQKRNVRQRLDND